MGSSFKKWASSLRVPFICTLCWISKGSTQSLKGQPASSPPYPLLCFGVLFSLFPLLSRLGQGVAAFACCKAVSMHNALRIRRGQQDNHPAPPIIITIIKMATLLHLKGRRRVTRCTPIEMCIRTLHALPCRTGLNPRKPGPQFLQGWPHHKEGSWGEA